MKEKKTVGFDILDNMKLDGIDRIGADTDMLDEKTKKRILEMTRMRYDDAIKGGNTGIYNKNINESAEIVENVEVYNRSKIRKIMTGVINTAAVVGLVAGSAFAIKGFNGNNKPVEPDTPAVSTTESVENLTQEEIARNQRIEEYIQELYYAEYSPLDENEYYEALKIEYAYLDLNNDSTDELFIYHFNSLTPDYESTEISCFDGTKYVPVTALYGAINEYKFDLKNCKLYSIMETEDNKSMLITSTWADSVLKKNSSGYFKIQDKYSYETVSSEFVYKHNDSECTKEDYDKAIAEYENCVGAELNFIPYTVKRETAEETARNQRIEEYIQELYNRYGMPDEEQFYECLDIKYAYLDINNDSVSELLVYYDFVQAAAYAKGIGLNYFDGTEYVHFNEVWDTAKFDLNNRRLYDLSESHLGEQRLEINTWENVEFSGNEPFFTFYESYYTEFGATVDDVTYYYNNVPCTKEKFESAWAEYENCDSAELNFVPYNVKKPVSSAVQTQAVDTNNEETIQTTIAATNKPTQEVLDKARDAALEARFDKHDKNNFVSMYYAYYDINDDSVPELIIDNEFNLHWEMEIYKFNSTDFEFKTSVEHTQGVILCKSEKSIEGNAKTPSMVTNICYYNDELEFGSVDKWILGYNYDENGNIYDEYKHNDTVITEEEYRAHVHNCDNCVFFNDVEFLLYQTNNPQGNEEIARERLFINKYSPRDYSTTYYAHTDLNSDGKSELVVLCRDENNIETVEMYSFNGDEYVSLFRTTGIFKLDLANNRLFSGFAVGDDIKYIVVKTWDSECNLTTLKSISQTDEGFKETVAEYEACKGVNLEYNQCW